jgi:hypothetical protein
MMNGNRRRPAWSRGRTAAATAALVSVVVGSGVAAALASSGDAGQASDQTAAARTSEPVIVSGSLADPANYAIFKSAEPEADRKAAADAPSAPVGANADTVRALTLDASAPTGARAWASYGEHGPCIMIQLKPGASGGGACSGAGDHAPEVIIGAVPVPNDTTSGLTQGHVVIAGLAPDGVKTVTAVGTDGTRTPAPVLDNTYVIDSPKPIATVELGVQTTTGVTQ